MPAELKQVANGFSTRVTEFTVFDVNGYRFRTRSYEEKRPGLKTKCTGVRTTGNDKLKYYGIVEEIYQLDFPGPKALKPVVFKCHWFDPHVTRRADDIGIVEIRQDSVYKGDDHYIVAQLAKTQVYYLPWACQKDKRLAGWYIAQLVSPRGKTPAPNDDDYDFDPKADSGEFYQPEGLDGRLEIDILSLMAMDEYKDIDEDDDEGEVVQDAKDLMMLERWRALREQGVEDDGGGEETTRRDEDGFDNTDSGDDSSDADNGEDNGEDNGDDNADSDDEYFGF